MNMHSLNLIQRTADYNLYEIRPKYLPPKSRSDTSSGFIGQMNNKFAESAAQGDKVNSVDELTAEQKEALRAKLNRGQGGLTAEAWDTFLMDLVDIGLISNHERMLSNGSIFAISNPNESGGWNSTVKTQTATDIYEAWDGNPLHYLDAMDVYLMKECKYAELNGNPPGGLATQQSACAKISSIVKSILYK